jgi:hypothetical protein
MENVERFISFEFQGFQKRTNGSSNPAHNWHTRTCNLLVFMRAFPASGLIGRQSNIEFFSRLFTSRDLTVYKIVDSGETEKPEMQFMCL